MEYASAGNPAYIALIDSDFTAANGLLSIDPAYLENEVWPSYEAAGRDRSPAGRRLPRRDAARRRPRVL